MVLLISVLLSIMDGSRKKRHCQPGKLQELLRERRRTLAAKLGTTEDFPEFNTVTTPKPKQKRSLRHLAAPAKNVFNSPIEKPTKSARGLILGVESPEFDHFCTMDDKAGSSRGKSKLSRVDIWTKAHKKKSNIPVTSEVEEALDKLKTIQQDPTLSRTTNVFEDALTVVLGLDRREAIRGFGRGINATKLELFSERDDNISHLEDKCCKMEEQGASTVRSEEQSNEPILSPLD
ncbi:hypothetical protein PanWU01x14_012950 [Parasponia andersonii]|uniref:Uncharacterized protein n=1 Tax=Parasponia andersonii TaxID=3476 RepID=A0A2P5E0W3_PARAD|nr:hypothetical protein PanWU01x14_012950 [Parasponia andersonii]